MNSSIAGFSKTKGPERTYEQQARISRFSYWVPSSWTPHRSPSQEDCNRESHFVTTKQHLSKIEDPGSYALGLLTRWTKAVTQISSWLVQMIRKEFQGPGLIDVMVY